MSQENIEFMRGVFTDWNRRDWKTWKAKHHADMVAIPDPPGPSSNPCKAATLGSTRRR